MKLPRLHSLVVAAGVVYAAVLLAAWLTLHLLAETYWWATVALFAPRWLWTIPLPVLAPLLALQKRRWSLALLVLLVAGAMALLAPNVPWRRMLQPTASPQARALRVLSLNCDSLDLKPAELRSLIDQWQPDIVALQDIRPIDFYQVFAEASWQRRIDGDLALASRLPILDTEALYDLALSGMSGALRRYRLEVDGAPLEFVNLHLSTPRWGLQAVQDRFWRGRRALQTNSDARQTQSKLAERWLADSRSVIIAGDFNTPRESPLYREYWSRYANAFRTAGWGMGNTFFLGWNSLAIDQVLYDDRWTCLSCTIGPDLGSAHRPLMATFGPRKTF